MDSRAINLLLESIQGRSRRAFEELNTLKSFSEYVALLGSSPRGFTRNAARYLVDMIEHFGIEDASDGTGPARRFRLFQDGTGDGRAHVFGQESVHEALYAVLSDFVERGRIDRMLLLHGPTGSSKSSTVEALLRGLEAYSRTPEGCLYRFNWIFCESADRGDRIGFEAVRDQMDVETLAFVDPKHISARIPCELRDPPWLLIPKAERIEFLTAALGRTAAAGDGRPIRIPDAVGEGDLCPKCRRIHDILLQACRGDWLRVMRHIQVERWFISRRYRAGAVTIEPQGTVDAGSRQIGHATMDGLPPVLRNEPLFEAYGDLIEANHGIVEYSDFFKRNFEANKYLLTTSERGTIHLPSFTAEMDLVIMGTTDEIFLSAFKRDPTFHSFKGRVELIAVPYLLRVSQERRIYERHLRATASGSHVAPHVAGLAALFAVLTRLRRPDASDFPPPLGSVVRGLTPLQKARLYDDGSTPDGLRDEEKRLLRGAIPALLGQFHALEEEFEGIWDAAYEGRHGASPREMMSLLSELAFARRGGCVTPQALFDRLPALIAHPSLYAFLRLRPDHGYHDCQGFLESLRAESLRLLREEIEEAADLVVAGEYERLFESYFRHVRAYATKERVLSEKTGQHEPPDEALMGRVEKLIGIVEPPAEFRSNLLAKAGSWRLENPGKPPVWPEIFADQFRSLRRNWIAEQADRVAAIARAALALSTGTAAKNVPRDVTAAGERMIARLRNGRGWCDICLREALAAYLKAPVSAS